jgi:uncharacterized protein
LSHSLRDQLLKAGLVNEKQANKAKQEKRKQAKQQRKNKTAALSDTQLHAQQALAEKTEHDRRLNRERQQASERKAREAQIKQLIETNRLSIKDGEIPYHFEDDKKIKKIYVPEGIREQLAGGRLAIVRSDTRYDVVPVAVAEKIRTRDEQRVIFCNETQSGEDADDSYADYQVPDDLIW